MVCGASHTHTLLVVRAAARNNKPYERKTKSNRALVPKDTTTTLLVLEALNHTHVRLAHPPTRPCTRKRSTERTRRNKEKRPCLILRHAVADDFECSLCPDRVDPAAADNGNRNRSKNNNIIGSERVGMTMTARDETASERDVNAWRLVCVCGDGRGTEVSARGQKAAASAIRIGRNSRDPKLDALRRSLCSPPPCPAPARKANGQTQGKKSVSLVRLSLFLGPETAVKSLAYTKTLAP
ncbi:hypothetical protein QTP88_013952 [Uroleucon formosanum]